MTAETATVQQNGNKHHGKKNKHHKPANVNNTLVGTEEQIVGNGVDVEIEETSVSLTKFVNRISSIPILQDGASAVHGYVNQNSIGRIALSTAATSFTAVHNVTKPYQKVLKGPIDKVGEFSLKSLDIIEQRFPLVTQPTVEVIEAVKKPPMVVYDVVKTRIDSTITTPASNIAKGVNQRVTFIVDNVEAAVDGWLPSHGEHAHADETNQVTRVYKLSLDVSNRLIHHANIHLEKNNIPRSRDDLVKLAETNALLKVAFQKILILNETLSQWVLLTTQAAKDRLPESLTQRVTDVTVSAQIHYEQTREVISKHFNEISAELYKQLETIKVYTLALPSFIKQGLEPLIEFANTEYDIIRAQAIRSDITTIEKAREIVAENQKVVLPHLQTSVTEVQEQLKYYSEVATQSKDKVVSDVRIRLQSFGVSI